MERISLIDVKQELRIIKDILLIPRTELSEYQKDTAVISYLIGRLEGKIELSMEQQENAKKEG